ncbi:hypothetical protein FBY35_6591 [Streptomyces sp. SLBN-118]|uniref:hypothetical protein n=1 Tax=Streptomyces sp. SLBN-118 TaxID=2768454 RepID=UPI00114E223C|nr:hypothetical protein [Streptomyces sp. SLBN-118]TQK45050.1 hypothetical protein FBY35_6591 [Streptomyces sp. SLBN-118]
MNPMDDPQSGAWAESIDGAADYLEYLSQNVGLAEWAAVSRVFFPQFVEVDGCVLWDRVYDPDNLRIWREELKGDVSSIEATLNQFRLWQYIEIDDDESQRRAFELAREIAASWRGCLERSFPGRSFDVQATDTVDGPVVSFTSLTA